MKITTITKLALVNGWLLDGNKGMEPQDGKVVLVEGDTITGILSAEEWENLPEKAEYEEYDLAGKYCMPGLINMHVHLAGNGKPQKKQRNNAALVKFLLANDLHRAVSYRVVCSFAKLELLSGVTTIRTVGGLSSFDTRCRDEIAAGKRVGPRILAANEGISVPDGHMAGSVAITANTIHEALRQVDVAKAHHTDLIKLMVTGGVLDAKEKGVPGEVKMQGEMIKAVCDRAHELGFTVAAHVESTEGVRLALANGVDSIEHGAEPDAEIMDLFRKNNAFLTTTISPALPYALFDRKVSNASEVEQYNGNMVFNGIISCTKACLEQNIPIALGNDVGCPYITQYDFWRELYWLHKFAGVSNGDALHYATLGNAKLARIDDITGSVTVGKKADLIVTARNPLEDLQALRTVDCVIANGNRIDKPEVKRKAIVDAELDKFL